MFEIDTSSKNRSPDRILVLKPKEGEKPLDATGMIDQRIFTGKNNLHAVMETETCLWYLKLDMGILPPLLKQKFTSFAKLRQAVEQYYGSRNIVIAEVKD